MINQNQSLEIWKDIPEYEGFYQVSNFGRIKSLERKSWNGKIFHLCKEKILKIRFSTKKEKKGHEYQVVGLNKHGKGKTFLVHQLMAICFLNHDVLDKGFVVDHIDGDKCNNNLSNLQIITYRQNTHKSVIKNNSTSKYIGVSKKKKDKKWRALICIKGTKQTHIGLYTDELKARDAYLLALNNIHRYQNDIQFRELVNNLLNKK